MPGHALLIGSALDGLSGVDNDLDAMQRALDGRGLTVERCTGASATRAGILAAAERLIAAAEPGQAAVLYYSGHGGRVEPPDGFVPGTATPTAGTPGTPTTTAAPGPDLLDLQFVVPTDFHDSAPGDFRGITSVELSALLARLTRVTRNATAIFDCCHAAHMARDGAKRVRAVPDLPPYQRLQAHIERLRAAGELPADLPLPGGNPDLVRIVACAPDQSAYEYEGADGRQIGMLTESLAMALAEAGATPVSWAALMDRIRRRVLLLEPGQRPEAEGPSRRLAFDTAEEDPLSTLPVTPLADGRAGLECAPLLGVQRGDRFLIMPEGAAAADEGTSIGALEVDQVGALSAQGPITFHGGATDIPIGARAHRVAAVVAALPVLLPSGESRCAALERDVALQPLLRPAEPGEQWLAAVRVDADGRLSVEDQAGPLHAPRPADGAGFARTVRDLTSLARAAALRALTGDPKWALGAAVTLTWGRVVEGSRQPLPAAGSTVHAGQPIYISARNGGDATVYVSLIDIGAAGRITLLTAFSPSGESLGPGREYVYGFDYERDELAGLPANWPEHLDPAHARPETVMLLVTSKPQAVTALQQDGVTRTMGRPASPLEALLAQIRSGETRELGSASGPGVGYDVHTLAFELDPSPDAGGFLIDERPDPAALHRAVRALGPSRHGHAEHAPEMAPTKVAVRIDELVVHRNHALFGADIRVDAIVLTAPHDAGQPTYEARTARFAHIHKDEPLPLDRMLVYHGPAADFLDIALWVSRDVPETRDLSALLAEEFSGFELQEALAKLSDSVTTVPYAGAAVAALGLSAVVVNVAYKLLRGTVNNVIGLYRGSMLAHECFGAGRHPAEGLRRVQGFSLAFTIEEVLGTQIRSLSR